MIAARANAAAIDMGIVGALCATLLWSRLLSSASHPALNCIAGSLLAAVMLLELRTGLTPGKFLFHLSIRRFRDSSQFPQLRSLLVRGLVRLFPVMIFLPAIATADAIISLLIWSISIAMILCYLPTCYLILMRQGRTLFDTAAGTIVIHRA
jgi:hypothetical protein